MLKDTLTLVEADQKGYQDGYWGLAERLDLADDNARAAYRLSYEAGQRARADRAREQQARADIREFDKSRRAGRRH